MESGDAEVQDLIRGEEEALRRELETVEVCSFFQALFLGVSVSPSLLVVFLLSFNMQSQLVKALIPRDEADEHSAILEVRAGQCVKEWALSSSLVLCCL